ncbi:MAG: glycosyltransferase family 9 protein [Alphaproteobacteria bacterium]
MKVLFITSNRIGDAILSSGLLGVLVDTYRDASFTIAAGPASAPLFTDIPRLDRLITIPKLPYAGHWRKLWLGCATTSWDIVVDLRGTAISWLLWTKARAVYRPQFTQEHRVVQLARVLKLDTPAQPRIWCSGVRWDRAANLVPDSGGPLLALGPAANWCGKQWPAARFVELVARLTATDGLYPGARVMLFGGPGENEMAQPLVRAIPEARRIDLIGRVDLLTAYACLRKAALYIGNDSGLMHLAAAAGIPTLGLFGPSKEVHYAPWGPHALAVRGPQSFEDIIGAPGYDHRSGQSYMTALTVDRVYQAVTELLTR